MRLRLLDLEEQFAFYGAYHSNPVNIFIHILFVWPIFYTALVLLYFTPSLFDLPRLDWLMPVVDSGVLAINWGFFFTLTYALFYLLFDRKAGSFAAFLCFACWVSSSAVANRLGYTLAWKAVLGAQLFCWTFQFLGHGVFEKRAPALLDNLVQAFLMAPFFVLLEVLEFLFGYEPYPGFHASVKAKVQGNRSSWLASRQKKIP